MIPKLAAFLFTALCFCGHASAQTTQKSPPTEAQATTTANLCGAVITTPCLVDEIQSYLTDDLDIFKRQRIFLALAQAQLADGRTDEALETSKQLDATSLKVEFLFAHAKRLFIDEEIEKAKERLEDVDRLLAAEGRDFGRLNSTGHSQRLAKALARVGDKDRARAVIEDITSVAKQIPLNPMLMSLILQISETQAEIGSSEEGARTIRDTYGRALDQGMELTPEQALKIFENWANLDSPSASKAAEELVEFIGEDGPSAFEFAVWTGLARGMNPDDPNTSGILERASSSFAIAPEREAAIMLLPKLAISLKDAGQKDKGIILLNKARTEVNTLHSMMDKAQIMLELVQAYREVDEDDQAAALLQELITMTNGDSTDGQFRHIMMSVPAQLALLGKFDDAYKVAMEFQDGSRQMTLVMAADKIVGQGNYYQAMRFMRQIDGEMAPMLMAGIADRLQDTQTRKSWP